MTREEALQAIKAKMDYYDSDKRLRGALETLIPELNESEDERIRKALIEGVSQIRCKGDVTREQMITYLENLKEEEGYEEIPVESTLEYKLGFKAGKESEKLKETGINWIKSDNVKNPDKPYIDKAGMFYTTDGRMCYASEIEKLKEQKPTEWSEEEVLNRTYEEGFNDGLKYRKPVKRSDEDKKMSNWLIGLVNANTELSFKDKVNLTRWLEHLTIEKELPKNDKRIMDAIMIGYQDKDFRSSQIQTPIGVSKDEVMDWLKSLPMRCPKSSDSWKPSEEQMDSLGTVVKGAGDTPEGSIAYHLKDLFEQLKKL